MSRRLIAIVLILGFSVFDIPVWGAPPGAGRPEPAQPKVDPAVYAALEKSADGTVLVEVTLTYVKGHPRLGHTWALMSQKQDAVLARLKPGEFEVMYRPDHTAPMMVGRASADSLAGLSGDLDVVAVKLGKITSDVHLELDKSDDGSAFVCIVLRRPAGDRCRRHG